MTLDEIRLLIQEIDIRTQEIQRLNAEVVRIDAKRRDAEDDAEKWAETCERLRRENAELVVRLQSAPPVEVVTTPLDKPDQIAFERSDDGGPQR